MDDNRIIEMYFARDERAIEETKTSYGRLIRYVAKGIVINNDDVDECEVDTYVKTWESIPPTKPTYLSAYLTKITRNLAINKLRDGKKNLNAELVFEEISEFIPDSQGDITENIALRELLNEFLENLGKTKRQIFVKRYFYMRSIKEIAREMGITTGVVKVTLSRIRKQLREYLEERGVVI